MHQRWLNSITELEQHLLPCPFKWLTGCDCPACGTQRSLIHLVRGEILLSWQANPLGLGLIAVVLMYAATSKFGSLKWLAIRKVAAWVLMAAVFLQWFAKMLEGTCCN
jgi:hypothetical protein